MHATDHARNQTEGMTLDQYVRHCAGLGLVVRVYTWGCAKCSETAVKAQAINKAIKDDREALAFCDDAALLWNPKCCGASMGKPTITMRDGSAGLTLL